MALQIKRWLFGSLGMVCLGLAVDVFLEHYFTIYSMRQPQWIPMVFGPRCSMCCSDAPWAVAI